MVFVVCCPGDLRGSSFFLLVLAFISAPPWFVVVPSCFWGSFVFPVLLLFVPQLFFCVHPVVFFFCNFFPFGFLCSVWYLIILRIHFLLVMFCVCFHLFFVLFFCVFLIYFLFFMSWFAICSYWVFFLLDLCSFSFCFSFFLLISFLFSFLCFFCLAPGDARHRRVFPPLAFILVFVLLILFYIVLCWIFAFFLWFFVFFFVWIPVPSSFCFPPFLGLCGYSSFLFVSFFCMHDGHRFLSLLFVFFSFDWFFNGVCGSSFPFLVFDIFSLFCFYVGMCIPRNRRFMNMQGIFM